MADVFEKFKSSVNKGITTISVKTSSSLEKSKIKTHIGTLTKEVDDEFKAIGAKAYKLWEDGADDYSVLIPEFEAVKAKLEQINSLDVELNSIDDRDNQILGTATQNAPVDDTPKFFCTNCGQQYSAPFKFCRKCGHKMEE